MCRGSEPGAAEPAVRNHRLRATLADARRPTARLAWIVTAYLIIERKAKTMTTYNPSARPSGNIQRPPLDPDHPRTLTAFRTVRLLVTSYLGISLLTVVAIALLRNNAAAVNSAVWTRGTIVALTALLTFAFTLRAARGSRRAYLRLRIISSVMVAAIAVIIALPGTFPVWMKIEQGVCGLVLIRVAVVVNGKHLRTLFADLTP